MGKRILWYVIHETLESARGNQALLEAAKKLPDTTIVDLYREYPDFKIDVKKEQQRLKEHDLIVSQFPFYWYSSPALFKQWLDKVLVYGFAYPPSEGKELHGKAWLSVITAGGPEWSYRSGGYNNFTMSELLRPFQQAAYLCGMKWLPPFVVHAVLPGDFGPIKATTNDELKDNAEALRKYIESIDLDQFHSLEPLTTLHYLEGKKG